MKKIFVLTAVCSLFLACEKENLLEGNELGTNPFENRQAPVVEIDSIKEFFDCSVVQLFLTVHEDRIPDTVVYTHYRITLPNYDPILTDKTRNIWGSANCSGTSVYTVSLYHEDKKLSTVSDTFLLHR